MSKAKPYELDFSEKIYTLRRKNKRQKEVSQMVLWENEKNGKPIGSLREKHIKERMCMEVCTKPSA